jgi:hypothetical protein
MVKKEYMKPAMQVVQLRQQHHILTISNHAVQGINKNNAEGLKWDVDGFEDEEKDM